MITRPEGVLPGRSSVPDDPLLEPALPGETGTALDATRFPCSPSQRRFWMLDRMEPGNPALNIAVRWRLEGQISRIDLDQAFAQIIERHQPLRMFIAEQDGDPVQAVLPRISFRVPEIDLSALKEEDAFAEAERIALMEARAAFDLSVPPLFRVTLLRVRRQVSIVLLTAHHLACDGWSIGIIAREMGLICAAINAGKAPELAILPASYGDYSRRCSEHLASDASCSNEEFWLRSLKGLRYFELHPDHPRPPVQTSNGNIVSMLLDRSVTRDLLDVSRRSNCTLFMTALTALFTLLHRYSGESDIAIGSQVAGRDDVDLEPLVGVFINTMILRGDLSGDPSFAELLTRVRDMVFESFEHSAMPFDRLIELLKPQRDLSRNPLFSINFIFQRSFIKNEEYGRFRLVDMPSRSAGALYDLNFFMVERPDGWRLSCEYNTDLFELETVGGLLHHFVNVLHAVAADSSRAISAIPVLGEAELHTLITECNRTTDEYPGYLTTPLLFELQARRTPEAVAVLCGELSLSYRELDLAANRLAHELHGRGIGRGSRVGICLERSLELPVALLAVLKSGAAYVPLDPRYPRARLAQIVEDAKPAVVLSKRAVRDHLPSHPAATLLLDEESETISQQRETPLDLTAMPDDVAYVIFTSGSTGRPKGVQIPHRALCNFLWSMRDQPGLSAEDTLVAVTTVSFDIAALELFLPLIVGAKLVIAKEEEVVDGSALLHLLRRHQATVMQATPVTWQILLAAGWRADTPLKMLCGGEALSRPLADQLLAYGGELWNLYGPTETTIWSSALRVEQGSGPVPIGPPIANTQFYVLDRHQQLVPMGAPGELFIGGDGVALGYLNLPEKTRERFVPDPFRAMEGARLYRTGDLVRMRRGVGFEFLGRSDHQIKLRGFRIELGEIESVIRAHAQVSDAVAIVGTDAAAEPAIHAYAAARQLDPVQAATLANSLQASLRQSLPAYMCPSSITVLDALPRMPNGKIDRSALPDPHPAPIRSHESGLLLSALERRLATIWSEVLQTPEIAADANFFEIGGHSLLAMRLLARIESEFGRRLSLIALFKNPSIAEQARLLEHDSQRSFDFRQVLKLQPNGSRPPLIAINNTGIYYALSKQLRSDQPFISLQLFDPALPDAILPKTLEDIAAGYAELIRRVQPRGPYTLLGWCIAGTLAFEIARQLTASGQTVSQLVLFDTYVPGYLKRLPWLKARLADYSYRWKLIAADWARTRNDQRRLLRFIVNRTIVKKLARWILRGAARDRDERLAQGDALSPEQYDQWLLNYLQRAADSYEPKPYSGKITLFRSSQEPAGRFIDQKMGWAEFAEGGVDVLLIDGDHFSIFKEPAVAQVARKIEAALDRDLLGGAG